MLSSLILQHTIDGLHTITRREFFVLDNTLKVIAAAGEADEINFADLAAGFIDTKAESQLVGGYQFFKVFDENTAEYVLVVRGEDDEAYRVGKMAAFQIQGLVAVYKERFDHDNFMKHLLLDSMLPVDIQERAKKLRIDLTARRVVFVADAAADAIGAARKKGLGTVADKHKDFVFSLQQDRVIVVKDIGGGAAAEIDACANAVSNAFAADNNGPDFGFVRIGVSAVCDDLAGLARAYKEASNALEIGLIFDDNNKKRSSVINYDKLGLARLIFNLPPTQSRDFVGEVLGGVKPHFDAETLATVDKFFENNLNVSETARQLYIHRNTLIYRLDKLQKTFGLDVRNFDDAVVFKLVLMIGRYLDFSGKRNTE